MRQLGLGGAAYRGRRTAGSVSDSPIDWAHVLRGHTAAAHAHAVWKRRPLSRKMIACTRTSARESSRVHQHVQDAHRVCGGKGCR